MDKFYIRKFFFAAILTASLPLCAADWHDHYKTLRDYLGSRVYHETGKAPREACVNTLLPPNSIGGFVVLPGTEVQKILPLSDVASIDVIGDEITLPSAMVVQALTEGRLGDGQIQQSTNSGINVEVRFTNKECYGFKFLSDDKLDRAVSGSAWISIPKISGVCSAALAQMKLGMSRAEFEKSMHQDGGIYAPFAQERYVMNNCPMKGGVVKLNVAFKPAGMSDAVYFSGKRMAPQHTSPNDTLMRVSPPYLDYPYYD